MINDKIDFSKMVPDKKNDFHILKIALLFGIISITINLFA